MANTYTRINYSYLTAGTTTIDFTSIPQTYTDLLLLCSTRAEGNALDNAVRFNNDSTSIYSWTQMQSGASSGSAGVARTSSTSTMRAGGMEPSTYTSYVFNNTSIYIPAYTSSNYKSVIADGVDENNSTTNYSWFHAGLWRSTAAINRVQFFVEAGGNLAAGSQITLYGIKNTP